MRRVLTMLTLVVALFGATAVPAAANDGSGTLADQILADADGEFDRKWRDYDIIGEIVKAILESGIPTSLGAAADPNAELTVFLPNDGAFRILAWDLTGRWIWREKNIIPAILDAVDGDLELVNAIVEYHVVPGVIDSAAALEADGVELTTVQGGTFTVDVISKRRALVRLIDNDPNDFDPWLVRRKLDRFADNGVWHGINLVLRPIDIGIKWEW